MAAELTEVEHAISVMNQLTVPNATETVQMILIVISKNVVSELKQNRKS